MTDKTETTGERFYIKTFGCQMNMYDSQVIQSILEERGLKAAEEPSEADIILVNGCSIRKHAEDRAINWIHQFSRMEDKRIAVIGCLAQNLKHELLDMIEGIDIICGPDNYMSLVDEICRGNSGVTMPGRDHTVTYSLSEGYNPGRYSGFVSITRGCENFCSYCVVPYLRGKLRSKDPDTLVEEVNRLALGGCREITLLGQNILAYQYKNKGFTELLRMLLERTALERIRFLTSHPRDVNLDLFRLMSDHPRICPHIHLPLQSGSDRILKLMRRGYTSGQYLSLLEEARKIMPGLAVTTDIIVGFPSEREEDFKSTMETVRKSGYDSAFTFKYSPRKGTAAWRFPDNVSAETKKERLARLNALVREMRKDILEGLLGKSFKILLDGTAERGENQYFKGRTPHFRNVLLGRKEGKEGDILNVTLERLENFTFIGKYRR